MKALLCTTAPPLTENAVQHAGEVHPQKHKQTERCIATLNPDTVIMCTACLQESFYSPGNKTRAHPHVAPKQQPWQHLASMDVCCEFCTEVCHCGINRINLELLEHWCHNDALNCSEMRYVGSFSPPCRIGAVVCILRPTRLFQ